MNDVSPLAVACRVRASTRALQFAFTWAVVFTAMHGYWYLGGRFGVGDGPNPLPGAPSSPATWIFTILVVLMFALGLAVPIALLKGTQRKIIWRLLVALLWAAAWSSSRDAQQGCSTMSCAVSAYQAAASPGSATKTFSGPLIPPRVR